MSRFFRCLALLAMSMLMLSSVGLAARHHVSELTYFQAEETKVNGSNVFRIEIGTKDNDMKYTVSTKPYLSRQIILDIDNMKPGKLRSNISLKSELARQVEIQEQGKGHTQVRITCLRDMEEGTYKVYTLPADRKQGKPFRIVIDIMKDQAPEAGTVAGVKNHTIVLDPGHGGSDSGAIGPRGVTEKEVTLAVAKKVQNILENGGAKVVMTRETDRDVYGVNATDRQELQARVDVGTRVPDADIFVSIHCNAFSNPAAHGTETYYYSSSSRGYRLASLLDEELIAAGKLFNRGVKAANFYVIHHSPMPASLVELAFITNPEEERLLSDDSYQNRLAMAIAKGISRYFGN